MLTKKTLKKYIDKEIHWTSMLTKKYTETVCWQRNTLKSMLTKKALKNYVDKENT